MKKAQLIFGNARANWRNKLRKDQDDWISDVLLDLARFLERKGYAASTEGVMDLIVTVQTEQKIQREVEREYAARIKSDKQPN